MTPRSLLIGGLLSFAVVAGSSREGSLQAQAPATPEPAAEQALVGKYYETGKSPLPCTALSSSCFIDAYWNLFACSIWDAQVGNLRENAFNLQELWDSSRRRELRHDVVAERCSHCWTPCEAYPTILGNLGKAAVSRGTDELQPIHASTT